MIAIVGAGAMGTALAVELARAGRDATILATAFDAPFLDARARGEPHPGIGVAFPDAVDVVPPDGWAEVLPKADVVVLAVATAGLVDTVGACVPSLGGEELWAIVTKGWDEETMRSAHEVVADAVGDPARVVAVVGPSIAREVAIGVPTAVVCASSDAGSARRVAEALGTTRFRTYTSSDVAGVEVGAILKNVIAIAIGICDGLAGELGVDAMTNAKAFVFSRGLVEMARLARALGGRPETVLGLAGAGDLFVTALAGRNGRFGRLIGAGRSPEQALEEMATTVEGYRNARTAATLAQRHGIELPVVHEVANVLYYGLAPREAIERLVGASVEDEL